MHQLTRRSILLFGGAAGITALATPAQASTPLASTRAALRQAGSVIENRASFVGAIGHTVTAISSTGHFRLRLLDILELGPAERFHPEQSFNLIFQAGQLSAVPDGIYQLGSARFPATTLLLTATGPAQRNHLQAVVNRSVPTT